MNTKDIIQLLERYYRGETTLEEERLLKDYFRSHDVPPHLQADREAFLLLDSQAQPDVPLPRGMEQRLSAQIDRWDNDSRRRPHTRFRLTRAARWYAGIAASLLIAAGAGLYSLHDSHPRDTFDNPELAYAETQRALQLFADALQKGQDGIEKAENAAQEVHATLEKHLRDTQNARPNN